MMPDRLPRPKLSAPAAAFTLIELLIVVAILGLLAVFLFPSFQRALESSRQTRCLGNLKQLSVAVHLYAAENNSQLPWAAERSSVRWETEIRPYLGEYKTWSKSQSDWHASGPYTCPATAKNYWLGYGWNYQGIGQAPNDPRGGPTRAGSGKGNYVMLADSIHAFNPEIVPGELDMIYGKSAGMPVPRPHNEGLNTLFVDGHAQWFPADTWYEDTTGRW